MERDTAHGETAGTELTDLARNLLEQLDCRTQLAADPEDEGLLQWQKDLVGEECLIRLEGKC